MRFAAAEPARDQEAGDLLTVVRNALQRRQPDSELLFGFALVTAEYADRMPVGYTVAQRLQSAPILDLSIRLHMVTPPNGPQFALKTPSDSPGFYRGLRRTP